MAAGPADGSPEGSRPAQEIMTRASFLACLAWMVYVTSGIHGWSLGKLGEEATAETVLGRKQRRQGWWLINGIYIAGLGDIDHVLVSTAGVFAIELGFSRSLHHLAEQRKLRATRRCDEEAEAVYGG